MQNKQGLTSKPKPKTLAIVPDERIIGKIYFIRGKKVMFDNDLAELYEVETKELNRAVRRNIDRFPDDFMFALNEKEFEILRCHFGTSNHGGRRYLPLVFTEQGVVMLSSVLKSKRAVQVSIQVARVFVQLREMLSTHKELREKIEKMEGKYDEQFKIVFKVLANLMKTNPNERNGEIKIIGFVDRKI
ncbi:MAG: ORF6N domain-containing protein [Candidatus Moraniibacteriota bacterium]